MTKILFPTDFSDTAKWAFEYAKNLAIQLDASITVLHAYHFDYVADVAPPLMIDALVEQKEESALQQFKAFTEQTTVDSDIAIKERVEINHEIRIGFAIDEIITYSEEMGADFIVMGTKGAHNVPEKILGSITSNVIRKAKCPVIAIPEGTEFKGIKNIAFASDIKNEEVPVFTQLLGFAKKFGADLHVIHINDGREAIKPQEKLVSSKSTNGINITFNVRYNLSLEDGLNDFIDEKEVDLLAIITHKRNFLQRLFNPSATKKMAFHTKVPLLAFHE